jgi:uncharacterized membrane protein
MSRLHKVFWHAARGPFTSLKIVLMGAACALGMALTATVFAPVLARVTLPLAMAFAIAVLVCCILLLTLVVARLNEVLAAIALEGSLRRQRLEPPNFFTDGAAATPSLESGFPLSFLSWSSRAGQQSREAGMSGASDVFPYADRGRS